MKSRLNIYPFGIKPLSWRMFVWNWEGVTQMKGRKITLDRSPLQYCNSRRRFCCRLNSVGDGDLQRERSSMRINSVS